jgi:hypothetical protein
MRRHCNFFLRIMCKETLYNLKQLYEKYMFEMYCVVDIRWEVPTIV